MTVHEKLDYIMEKNFSNFDHITRRMNWKSGSTSNLDINVTVNQFAPYVFVTMAQWTRAEGDNAMATPTFSFTNGTGTVLSVTALHNWAYCAIIKDVSAGTTINSTCSIYNQTSIADVYVVY